MTDVNIIDTNNRHTGDDPNLERERNSIQETIYLHSIPGLVDSILEARKDPVENLKAFSENEEW